MKIEREEMVISYNTEDEAFDHKELMELTGWKIRDVHPFLLKITYIK